MPDIFVQSFTHLKDKPNADKALHMLQRIASLVKPIMRKRSWVLPVLSEFFPDNPNLLGLNVNMGQKILVRLRPPFSPDTFMTEEDVVQTMLHELTHNVHGPHDDKFYKYLAGLQDEYDALQRSGYAGEGFFSEGKRLGANVSHNVSPHQARLKALEAAEKRAQTSRVLGSGGRLGGASRNAGLSPRELAARAAEQRIRDEKSCASGADAEREAAKAAKDSVANRNIIDLTLSSDEESDADVMIVDSGPSRPKPVTKATAQPQPSTGNNKVTSKATLNSKASPPVASTSRPTSSPAAQPRKPSQPAPKKTQPGSRVSANTADEWSCSVCTLLNPAHAAQCDACATRRPITDIVPKSKHESGWSCLTCGESGMPHDFWTCSWCGTVKLTS